MFSELNWKEVVSKYHQENVQKLDRLDNKIDMIMEAMQVLTPKNKGSDIIKYNTDERLPDLPLQDDKDVVRLNAQLADPVFMDQMVRSDLIEVILWIASCRYIHLYPCRSKPMC